MVTSVNVTPSSPRSCEPLTKKVSRIPKMGRWTWPLYLDSLSWLMTDLLQLIYFRYIIDTSEFWDKRGAVTCKKN
jgi:hypothetical protein